MKTTNHKDYRNVNMDMVKQRVETMAKTDAPTIPSEITPNELVDVLEEGMREDFLEIDKAAAPADRDFSELNLEASMARARPQILLTQRNSDAKKDVQESRRNALEEFSQVKLSTGSSLLNQIKSDYPSRVFHTSLPWEAGGPDFYKERNPKRLLDKESPTRYIHVYASITRGI